MSLKGIKRGSPLKRAELFYGELREQLDHAIIAPGARLPSEPQLAHRYGLSRGTVRSALDQLEREGRIIRRQGHGTFVLESPAPDPEAEVFRHLLENLEAISRRTRARILNYRMVYTPSVALAYSSEFGRRALFIERVRTYRGTPFAQARHWIPERLAPLFTRRRLGNRTTAVAFEVAGIEVAGGERWIGAIAAHARLARTLAVPAGTALLQAQRFIRCAQGRMIEFQEVLYRPDLYRVRMAIEWREVEGSGKHWVVRGP